MEYIEQAFGDMAPGTIFTDGSRNFLKLATTLPSGLPLVCKSFAGDSDRGTFNAIDNKGMTATVPQDREFLLVSQL